MVDRLPPTLLQVAAVYHAPATASRLGARITRRLPPPLPPGCHPSGNQKQAEESGRYRVTTLLPSYIEKRSNRNTPEMHVLGLSRETGGNPATLATQPGRGDRKSRPLPLRTDAPVKFERAPNWTAIHLERRRATVRVAWCTAWYSPSNRYRGRIEARPGDSRRATPVAVVAA